MSFSFGRYEFLFILFLLIISFSVRVWPIQVVHWWDETVYLQNAEVMFGLKEDNYNELEFRPPLLSFLIGVLFFIWYSSISSSILVALIGAIGVLFFYLFAREIFGEKEAFLSGLFFAFIPLLVSNSRVIMTDVPSLVFLIIGAFFFVKYLKTNNSLLGLVSGLFFSFALLMRYSTVPILACFLVVFIFIYKDKLKSNIKKVFPLVLGFIFPLVIFFAWVFFKYGDPVSILLRALSMISDVNYPFYYYLVSLPVVFTWFVLFGFLVAIVYFVLNFKKHKDKKEMFFILSFLFLLFILFASSHKEERYLIEPLSISLILLSSRGFVHLFDFFKKNTKATVTLGIIFAFCALLFFVPSFERFNEPLVNNSIVTDEYLVSQYVNGLRDSNTIYALNYWPVFGYYTNKKVIHLDSSTFYENCSINMQKDGFFVVHKGDVIPSKKWINSNSSFSLLKEINSFEVYYYNSTN